MDSVDCSERIYVYRDEGYVAAGAISDSKLVVTKHLSLETHDKILVPLANGGRSIGVSLHHAGTVRYYVRFRKEEQLHLATAWRHFVTPRGTF